MGAITGITSLAENGANTLALILVGSPTNPKSSTRSMFDPGVRILRRSCSALTKPPFLPEMPLAKPPAASIAVTMFVLISPASTRSTIFTVALSVTRSPASNLLSMPCSFSILPIWGPPPWTTTGLMPTCLINMTSRAKSWISAGLPMAWPPNLITKVWPAKARIYGSASDSVNAVFNHSVRDLLRVLVFALAMGAV